MKKLSCFSAVVLSAIVVIVPSAFLASAQERPDSYDLPLISEVVVVADVVSLRQTGALQVNHDGEEKELHLASIQLPIMESKPREKADEMLKKHLLGKSVEVHILGALNADDGKWNGYILHNGIDVRLELVAKGLARYCQGNRLEPEFERRDKQARDSEKGIWAKDQKDAVPSCQEPT